MDMPMLDEPEFARVQEAYSAAFQPRGERREPDVNARFSRVLELYREMTGFEETNPNAVLHHRLSLYGPPCTVCSKPYRSPNARFCAACGTHRSDYASPN